MTTDDPDDDAHINELNEEEGEPGICVHLHIEGKNQVTLLPILLFLTFVHVYITTMWDTYLSLGELSLPRQIIFGVLLAVETAAVLAAVICLTKAAHLY